MKILLVRHAEPDYTIDSLTPKGRREAELLSRRLCKLDVKNFYVSPQGRARDTASYTLNKLRFYLGWQNSVAAASTPPRGVRTFLGTIVRGNGMRIPSFISRMRG